MSVQPEKDVAILRSHLIDGVEELTNAVDRTTGTIEVLVKCNFQIERQKGVRERHRKSLEPLMGSAHHLNRQNHMVLPDSPKLTLKTMRRQKNNGEAELCTWPRRSVNCLCVCIKSEYTPSVQLNTLSPRPRSKSSRVPVPKYAAVD